MYAPFTKRARHDVPDNNGAYTSSSAPPSNLDHNLQTNSHNEMLDLPIENPNDISPITFVSLQEDEEVRKTLFSEDKREDIANFFTTFESSLPGEEVTDSDTCVPVVNTQLTCNRGTNSSENRRHKKKESTFEDKIYRSDREYVKRQSHQKMIWFFRQVGLRHPAAIRTHLEKVKQPEFELPNLQCVLPHPELSIAVDDESSTNLTYYNLYCATPALVKRVRKMMGVPKRHDPEYNKRIIAFIADIVGRLLWHSNRTHSVMFAKSDHYDRDCFLLYSRQSEPTPFMMQSDSFYCRRHDSEKFRSITPQPDLTRANSTRVSNESSIYVVGCNLLELWECFPYDYRITHCRPMKSLCELVKQIDPAVLDHAFSAINANLNGGREHSPYQEVASSTSLDVLSVLLRDSELKEKSTDDSTAYKEFLERFIKIGVLNVHSMLKCRLKDLGYESKRTPTVEGVDHIVLHNVNYRREVRCLRTNKVFYYLNEDNFVCSLSLLDDMFEDRIVGEEESNVMCRRPVYFYDILHAFEFGETYDINNLAIQYWGEVDTMIHESSATITKHITADVLNSPLPNDQFYPTSDMSPTDIAIDRILERAIKHSKKLKLLTPTILRRESKKSSTSKKATQNTKSIPKGFTMESNTDLGMKVNKSLSKDGENRMRDGYVSPSRLSYETVVTHKGEQYPLKISVGSSCFLGEEQKNTPMDFGPKPCLLVDEKLLCAYIIDPNDTRQIRMVHGSHILDKHLSEYVPLKSTDRIVRVFAIQSVDGAYVVKPYVYFIFRNTRISDIDSTLVDKMFESIKSYGDFAGFKVFDGVIEETWNRRENSSAFCNVQETLPCPPPHQEVASHDRQQKHEPISVDWNPSRSTVHNGLASSAGTEPQYQHNNQQHWTEVGLETEVKKNYTVHLGNSSGNGSWQHQDNQRDDPTAWQYTTGWNGNGECVLSNGFVYPSTTGTAT